MDTMAVELPDLSTHAQHPPPVETPEEKWVFIYIFERIYQTYINIKLCDRQDES